MKIKFQFDYNFITLFVVLCTSRSSFKIIFRFIKLNANWSRERTGGYQHPSFDIVYFTRVTGANRYIQYKNTSDRARKGMILSKINYKFISIGKLKYITMLRHNIILTMLFMHYLDIVCL